jgi:small subunit ribosomal protein S4
MGDPKKPKKKYSKPTHPWKRDRIEAEKTLAKDYGLVNKREIWKMASSIKNFALQSKKYIVARSKQAEIEKKALIDKLVRLGLIKAGGQIDDILSLDTKDLCERRFQTLVVRKGLARTMRQARQFIVHGHVCVGGNKVTAPGYIVSVDEENTISFAQNSNLANTEHPERTIQKKNIGKDAPKKPAKLEDADAS